MLKSDQEPINYTYGIVNWTSMNMTLKINFSRPEDVSFGYMKDYMLIDIKDQYMF